MSAYTAALRALPMTFAIFVFEALCSLFAALPVLLELARQPALRALDAADRAALLDLALELAPAVRVATTQALLALAALVLVSPWLQMSWLAALEQPRSPLEALLLGARRTPRAWLVSVCWALAGLALSLPFLALAYALGRVFPSEEDPQLHAIARLSTLAPMALVWLLLVPAHDLARARALGHPAWASLRRALKLAMQPGVQLRALGFFLLGVLVVAAAQWVARAASQAPGSALITAALVQGALLARIAIRSGWLASALACASSSDGPGVAAFEREVHDERVRKE